MKVLKEVILICFVFIWIGSFAQTTNYPEETSITCMEATWLCGMRVPIINSYNSEQECIDSPPVYFKIHFLSSGTLGIGSYQPINEDAWIIPTQGGNYTLYGPFNTSIQTKNCDQIYLGMANYQTGSFTSSSSVTMPHEEGYYIIKLEATTCHQAGGTFEINYAGYTFKNVDCLNKPVDCKDCISSFSPDPGEYIISAWVKGKEENINETSYVNPEIQVNLNGGGNPTTYSFSPSGLIIDGWQRIDGKVTIPQGSTGIEIILNCLAGNCYFDDIRFVPVDGSMKSYVYDPVTLKLVAELDERNYATFYEYDEEGKLIRVKKETERGIMTIQENRDNISK